MAPQWQRRCSHRSRAQCPASMRKRCDERRILVNAIRKYSGIKVMKWESLEYTWCATQLGFIVLYVTNLVRWEFLILPLRAASHLLHMGTLQAMCCHGMCKHGAEMNHSKLTFKSHLNSEKSWVSRFPGIPVNTWWMGQAGGSHTIPGNNQLPGNNGWYKMDLNCYVNIGTWLEI